MSASQQTLHFPYAMFSTSRGNRLFIIILNPSRWSQPLCFFTQWLFTQALPAFDHLPISRATSYCLRWGTRLRGHSPLVWQQSAAANQKIWHSPPGFATDTSLVERNSVLHHVRLVSSFFETLSRVLRTMMKGWLSFNRRHAAWHVTLSLFLGEFPCP